MGELGCGTSIVQYLGSSKFSDKLDVGPATWAHINRYIDACKCTEIFRNNFHARSSRGSESSSNEVKVLRKNERIRSKPILRRFVFTETRNGPKSPATILSQLKPPDGT